MLSGLLWILPAMLIIKWMIGKPEPNKQALTSGWPGGAKSGLNGCFVVAAHDPATARTAGPMLQIDINPTDDRTTGRASNRGLPSIALSVFDDLAKTEALWRQMEGHELVSFIRASMSARHGWTPIAACTHRHGAH